MGKGVAARSLCLQGRPCHCGLSLLQPCPPGTWGLLSLMVQAAEDQLAQGQASLSGQGPGLGSRCFVQIWEVTGAAQALRPDPLGVWTGCFSGHRHPPRPL